MRRATFLLALSLSAVACSQDRGAQRPDAAEKPSTSAAGLEAPPSQALASGVVTVRGGEVLRLRGATVGIDQVTYLNQPCPPDVRCIHSGVIKLVHFQVTRTGAPLRAAVPEGAEQSVDGVLLVVRQVRPGPEADIEASLPLTTQASPAAEPLQGPAQP